MPLGGICDAREYEVWRFRAQSLAMKLGDKGVDIEAGGALDPEG